MSEQTPTNLSNADFTFKDKYGNTGLVKGTSGSDSTKLNNMVKLMNLMLNTPNSTDFINTLATKQNVEEVIQALTSKADTTLANVSNVAQSFKDMSIGWGMPDYSAGISLTWGTTFTAPSNGIVLWQSQCNRGVPASYQINTLSTMPLMYCGDTSEIASSGMHILSKNDSIKYSGGSSSSAIFYPCKGV